MVNIAFHDFCGFLYKLHFLHLSLVFTSVSILIDCVSEYHSVNNALDEISAFMDVLEERNDDLFAKVQRLLDDSRHARLQVEADAESDQQKPSNTQQPASSTD